MKRIKLLYLLILVILPAVSYSSTCERVMAEIKQQAITFHNVFQRKVYSAKPQERLEALQMINKLNPIDNIYIALLPLLQDPVPEVRMGFLEILEKYNVTYIEVIATLNAHIKVEPIPYIKHMALRVLKKISHEKFEEYIKQGQQILLALKPLDAFIQHAQQLFPSIGIYHVIELDIAIDNILSKKPEDRSAIEWEVLQIFQQIEQASHELHTTLLKSPLKSYDQFIKFFEYYLKITQKSEFSLTEGLYYIIGEFYRNKHLYS